MVAQINDQMLVESAHSNPLLRPAVLNSKGPCCAFLLATILSIRCVEITFKPLHTIVNVQLDDLVCANMGTFLNMVAILVQLILMSHNKL